MDLFTQGTGKVTLNPADFVGQGGEASVYARGDTAYKVYTDPQRMIPVAKIGELSVLSQPGIIRPEAVLLDARDRPVGYTMRRVQGAEVLCRFFNRSFRERRGVTPDGMLSLVQRLQEGVRHVHERGILIVDLNEMNFLVDERTWEVLFIDVDSYQTPSFPATALMESVRDRHASRFSEATDWFSFAVVSFQMFAGVHPYKGKHPTLSDLDARMHASVSVLQPEVSVPATCYPFSVIPQAYLDWYRSVLDEGKRLAPPTGPRDRVLLPPTIRRLPGSDYLEVREIRRYPTEILSVTPYSGGYAVLTADGLYLGAERREVPPGARIGITPRMQHVLAAWIEGRALRLFDATACRDLPDRLEAEQLTTCGGRLFAKNGGGLFEVEPVELPRGLRAALRPVGNAMEHATTLFDGAALQNMLGAWYVSLFPVRGACHTVRLPALDGYRIVEARFDGGVLMAAAERGGRYDRFIFRFDDRYLGYDARVARDVDGTALDFVCLGSGVCVHLAAGEEVELFSARKDAAGVKVFTDPALYGVRLFRSGTQLLFAREETLYSASMR